MKHAYLIIAHNDFEILQKLVSSLDDDRNDIYIHYDKKVKLLPEIKAEKSGLFILDKRVDVRWGTVKQIEAELVLFESAIKNGPYSYFHLISGTHLPLKSQDEIHAFFNVHDGREVMHLWEPDPGDADFKLRRYHFWIGRLYGPGRTVSWVCQHFWTLCLKVQKMLGIRHMMDETFIKSDNWVSLTEGAVKYFVGEKIRILKKYHFSFCGDEYFAATEMNGKFEIVNCPNLLYVEFCGSNPKYLTMADYQRLKDTDFLFARKFMLDERADS